MCKAKLKKCILRQRILGAGDLFYLHEPPNTQKVYSDDDPSGELKPKKIDVYIVRPVPSITDLVQLKDNKKAV